MLTAKSGMFFSHAKGHDLRSNQKRMDEDRIEVKLSSMIHSMKPMDAGNDPRMLEFLCECVRIFTIQRFSDKAF